MKVLKCAVVDVPDPDDAWFGVDETEAKRSVIPLQHIEAVEERIYMSSVNNQADKKFVYVSTVATEVLIVIGPDFDTLTSMLENA